MEYINKVKETALKREEAIQEVKYNLKKYAQLKSLPQKFEDRVTSFTSSLISVTTDHITYNANKVLYALIREDEDIALVQKYDYLLTCLCNEYNQYITRIYFNNEKVQAIKDEQYNIWYILKDAYEILACLDEDINYNIEDYTLLKNYELKKRNDINSVKAMAIDCLRKFKNNSSVSKEINDALDKVPERERKQLLNYLNEDNYKKLTSYQYRMILRGQLAFAYFYKNIDFSYEDLESALPKTGTGWKKFVKQIND